jgi:hypothetical protein
MENFPYDKERKFSKGQSRAISPSLGFRASMLPRFLLIVTFSACTSANACTTQSPLISSSTLALTLLFPSSTDEAASLSSGETMEDGGMMSWAETV